MGAARTCLKVFFILMAVVVLLVVGAFAAGGITTKFYLTDLLQTTVQDAASNIFNAAGLPANLHPTVDPLDFTQILGDKFLLGVIVVGVLVFALVLLGMFGACFSRGLLIFFLVVYVIVWLVQLISFLMFTFGTSFDLLIKEQLMSTLVKFEGATATNTPSLLWTATQYLLQCCGVDNVYDIKSAAIGGMWNPSPKLITDEVQKQLQSPITAVSFEPMVYPLPCCKTGTIAYKSRWTSQTSFVVNFDCTSGPAALTLSNWNKGCFKTLLEYKQQYDGIINGAIGGWLAFQFLMLILAIILVVKMKNKIGEKEQLMRERRDPRSLRPLRPLDPYPEPLPLRALDPYPEPLPRRALDPYPEPLPFRPLDPYPEPLRVPREPQRTLPREPPRTPAVYLAQQPPSPPPPRYPARGQPRFLAPTGPLLQPQFRPAPPPARPVFTTTPILRPVTNDFFNTQVK